MNEFRRIVELTLEEVEDILPKAEVIDQLDLGCYFGGDLMTPEVFTAIYGEPY